MTRPPRLEALDGSPEAARRLTPVDRLWYAAYGSNMHLDRLTCYLTGGRPHGGLRTYPAAGTPAAPCGRHRSCCPVCCTSPPNRRCGPAAEPSTTPSPGLAPADDGPGRPGAYELPARAYLLTLSQFSDIAAQEMYREPGGDLDLTEALTHGRARIGPGRYETLVCAGLLDGYPVLTFTAPWSSQDITVNPPSAAYLRHIAAGIVASHGWSALRAAAYLAGCPGAEGHWTAAEIARCSPTRRPAVTDPPDPP